MTGHVLIARQLAGVPVDPSEIGALTEPAQTAQATSTQSDSKIGGGDLAECSP